MNNMLTYKESISLTEFLILSFMVMLIYIGALKKEKLTFGGANSALIIGNLMSIAGYEYLFIMASFFFSSNKVTASNKNIKEKHLGSNYKKESKRNAYQVMAKGFLPTIISLLIFKYYGGKLLIFEEHIPTFLKILYGSFLGFFISANADTWASEIGISSKNNPILITNFQRVPKGVNGGITLYGTIMSVLGGLFIGLVSLFVSGIRTIIFYKENISSFSFIFHRILFIIFISALGGFIGSLIDSILGATLQISVFDKDKGIIINKNQMKDKINDKSKYIIFGKDILSNSQVNFIAGFFTSCLASLLFVIFL